MYTNLVNVAKKIIDIAKQREQNQRDDFFPLADMNFSDLDTSYSNKLEKVLMNLSFDEVIALQTIMYLGRDKDYKGNTADEIFTDYLKYIKSLGVRTKELEVRQMVGKMPLGEYLTEGYKILGINL